MSGKHNGRYQTLAEPTNTNVRPIKKWDIIEPMRHPLTIQTGRSFLVIGLAFSVCACTVQAQGSKSSASSSAGDAQKSKLAERPILRADQFFGSAQLAYQVADKHKDLLKLLFSYGGEDVTDGFTSLYDCFTTDYAADDPLCQDEAILAGKLYDQGFSVARIQQIVDQKFSPAYPFAHDSPALQAYKARRLYAQQDRADKAVKSQK